MTLFMEIMLCDSICLLHQPKVPVQLEVVFVHGLERHNCRDAYWKSWLARDGTLNNIWPMTWLSNEFPSAKVFTLKYDASIKQTNNVGRMDLHLIGHKLLYEMMMFEKIGQSRVPVVFVCHGFGGLVVKKIVTMAKNCSSQGLEAQKLLKNIGAILFYSTPHHGSNLEMFSSDFHSIWGSGEGPLLENLNVLSVDISRLNQAFAQVAKQYSWNFVSSAETLVMKGYSRLVVDEGSSRFESGTYLPLSANYFDVVRPKSKYDSSYKLLTTCLKKVLNKHVVKPIVEEESLVPGSFVGMDEQKDVIEMILREVSMVGLVGMGGIGKTTLARAVYQSVHKDFDNSCYLNDVKSKPSLDEVLITLLQKFGIEDGRTSCIGERSGFQDHKESLMEDLKSYVHEHTVLVVIDDVGTKENLDYLLKNMDFLNGNKESKVIVTCRNWQLLKKYVKESGRYEVEPMSSSQATELFVFHAFKGARTVEERHENLLHFLSKDSSEQLISEFESICDDVVKACGGLPLSLEVMGCCLGGYLMDDDLSSEDCRTCWKGALVKLERAEPLEGETKNDRLWKALQISYDCLHKNEQNMFLDIACFFCDSVRYGEQTLLRILGGKQTKFIELRNLKERCLVKINKEDRNVTMHDQLRDMGRRVVREQCHERLNEMTRIWSFEHVSKLLRSNEIQAPQLQGLSLNAWGISPIANMISLECPIMRLLNLHEVHENVTKAINIKGLSCIQWLCLKKTNISELPQFVQYCNHLLVLDMSDCSNLMNLDESIKNFVNLLELNLSNCTSLKSLPDSIGELVNLSSLNINNCTRLRSLPESIGKLSNLSSLDITFCEQLKSLPDSIGELINLSTLDISFCNGLTSLPDSIGKLSNLSTLHIYKCFRLTSVPDSIVKLSNLSTLNISGCQQLLSLPDSIGKLTKLSTLDILGCTQLSSLPDSIGKLVNLSRLDIYWCRGLSSLPDSIGKLDNLSTLEITGCIGLSSLPDSIIKLAKLSKLQIFGREELLQGFLKST